MIKKSSVTIKNWGPLSVEIDERTKKLWGRLNDRANEILRRNIAPPNESEGKLGRDEFIRVLERVSRPLDSTQDEQSDSGKKGTSD